MFDELLLLVDPGKIQKTIEQAKQKRASGPGIGEEILFAALHLLHPNSFRKKIAVQSPTRPKEGGPI